MLRLLALALLTSIAASAQPPVPLAIDYAIDGTTAYDPDIPTPDAVLGYTIGERHTRPDEVIRYAQAVADASDRVTLGFHGTTYEGRRLVHAVVTSRANHGRLDAIQARNVALSQDPGSVSDAELAEMPVVVYQGYSVHGNEATGTEAALVWLYHLAAAQGPEIDRMLDRAVVLWDPMLNPDGRDRFVDWVNGYRGAVPVADPGDREHREAWPGGRTNHYWFDLNRDWLPDRAARRAGAAWRGGTAWRPAGLEHGPPRDGIGEATFFFQPGIPSPEQPEHAPDHRSTLTGEIATGTTPPSSTASGVSCTTPRRASTTSTTARARRTPTCNGAVGILFEQASSRALDARDRAERRAWTYAVTVSATNSRPRSRPLRAARSLSASGCWAHMPATSTLKRPSSECVSSSTLE